MTLLLKLGSLAGLILTIVPSFLVFSGSLSLGMHKILALIGTLLWMATAPFWINRNQTESAD